MTDRDHTSDLGGRDAGRDAGGHDLDPRGTDPLAALRDAWSRVEPPAPAESLDHVDPRTRATVAWMQAGWDALRVPEATVPRELLERPRRAAIPSGAGRRGWRLLEGAGRPLAAAALLVVLLGAPLLLTTPDAADRGGDGDTPPVVAGGGTGAEPDPSDPRPDDRAGSGGPPRAPVADADTDRHGGPRPDRTRRPTPTVVALSDTPAEDGTTPTGLQLRSGRVRLLLVGSSSAGL